MGDAVVLDTKLPVELLPRMFSSLTTNEQVYGIAVGGDADGIYGDGTLTLDPRATTLATTKEGEGLVVCTQGRCLARVEGTIVVGDKLVSIGSAESGVLGAVAGGQGDRVIAIALQTTITGLNIIAVDVQRNGSAL